MKCVAFCEEKRQRLCSMIQNIPKVYLLTKYVKCDSRGIVVYHPMYRMHGG